MGPIHIIASRTGAPSIMIRFHFQPALMSIASVSPPAAVSAPVAGSVRRACRATLLVVLLGALLPGAPAAARQQPVERQLRIVTFNAEHFMSPARFEAWRRFCAPLRWREPGELRAKGQSVPRRPEALTYCNALDGSDGRGRAIFAPVRDQARWQAKTDAIAALLRSADADIVLLQEVSDAEAARILLGPGYRVASTAELWQGHEIGQNLAIGWRPDVGVTSAMVTRTGAGAPDPLDARLELVEAISQAGPDGRRTRPGLALILELGGGRRLAILNLHLKAGCRQGRLDEVTSRAPERAFRRREACAVFRQQVPPLERWADEKLRDGYGVVIAGDFNRDLLREIRERMPARSDGSDAARTASPARIASLVAELSDEDPPAAWFSLVRSGRYSQLADCHRRIDNFLLSRNLEPWLAAPLSRLATVVVPFGEPVSLDRPRPSDHCPHLLRLPLRPADPAGRR